MNSASEKRTRLRQAQADILLSCWACRNMELVETWSLSKHGVCRNMELIETWREKYFEHTLIKIFKPN